MISAKIGLSRYSLHPVRLWNIAFPDANIAPAGNAGDNLFNGFADSVAARRRANVLNGFADSLPYT